jgi:hypothetical protein
VQSGSDAASRRQQIGFSEAFRQLSVAAQDRKQAVLRVEVIALHSRRSSVKQAVTASWASSMSSTGRIRVDWQWVFQRVRSDLKPP